MKPPHDTPHVHHGHTDTGVLDPVVELVDSDPGWVNAFARERTQLLRLLDQAGIRDALVEHIGSTAVPGLQAKPVIDIMVGIPRVVPLDSFPTTALLARGYQKRPIRGTRLLLARRNNGEKFNIHIVPRDGFLWLTHLAFRDKLRADAKTRREYQDLKIQLARLYRTDVMGYGAAKFDFIRGAIDRALRERGALLRQATLPTESSSKERTMNTLKRTQQEPTGETATGQEHKGESVVDGLRVLRHKAWEWPNLDRWQADDETVLDVSRMRLLVDEEGNWQLRYDVDAHAKNQTWTYKFEFRSEAETSLLVYVAPSVSRERGTHVVIQTGRAAELRYDFALLSACVRRSGTGLRKNV